MQILYTKPIIKDLSQGSRIAFARQFRRLSQDAVSDGLGISGECKRRTMTRYEKGTRNPKIERLTKISELLEVNINSIKEYDLKNPLDLVYILMWLEEVMPNYIFDINHVSRINNEYSEVIKKSIKEWDLMKHKRLKKEITYEEYINWKLNFKIEEDI